MNGYRDGMPKFGKSFGWDDSCQGVGDVSFVFVMGCWNLEKEIGALCQMI